LKINSPLISVIVPVYNRQDKVGRAIESVLNQGFSGWELILINDKSTDNSLGIINEYQDSRIVVLDLSENKGAATARNVGIKRAKGKFVTFLDSDDCYKPDFLEKSYRLLSPTGEAVGFSWTGYTFVSSNNQKTQFWKPSESSNYYHSFLESLHTGTNSGLMVKSEVFKKCGYFDERLRAAEDTDFLLRIIQDFKFIMIPESLVNIYIDHTNRLSVDFKRIASAYNLIYPKHEEVIASNLGLKIKWYYKMVWLNYHLGELKLARSFFKKLIQQKIMHYRAWQIFLIFEVLGSKYGAKTHVFLSKKIE
jgi:glycosyltransferase involved in cell wall biosynthesis